jgi:hypothetical protein
MIVLSSAVGQGRLLLIFFDSKKRVNLAFSADGNTIISSPFHHFFIISSPSFWAILIVLHA